MAENYYGVLQDLKKIGVPVYPGCRQEAVEFAVKSLGISLDEILNGLDDRQVLEAIDWAATQSGVYDNLLDESEE